MKIYGFDFDGVISQTSFSFFIHWLFCLNIKKSMDKFLDSDFIWNFYDKHRKVNPKIRKVIQKLKKDGNKIIIISANTYRHKEQIASWLKKNNIPYDELLLLPTLPKNLTVKDWKKSMIRQTWCNFYLEDTAEIVFYLRKYIVPKKRIIHYKEQTAEKILRILK